jgi:hypothetical protein
MLSQQELERRWKAQRAAEGLPTDPTGVQYSSRVPAGNRAAHPGGAEYRDVLRETEQVLKRTEKWSRS